MYPRKRNELKKVVLREMNCIVIVKLLQDLRRRVAVAKERTQVRQGFSVRVSYDRPEISQVVNLSQP